MFMMKRDNAIPSASSTPTVMLPLDEGTVSLPAQAMLRYSLKRFWLRTHLYLGLFGGALFVLMSLTGSILVFYKAIDEWLNPTQLTTTGSGPYKSLNEVVETAQAAAPPGGWLDSLELPSNEREVFRAWFKLPTAKLDRVRWHQVTIDPYSGTVLSRGREWGTYLVSVVYMLHASLLLEDVGETIVGFIAIFLLVSIGTGVFLWWPRGGNVRQAFIAVPGTSRIRRQFQWHKLSGAYGAIMLSVLAVTGLYLAFPTYVISVVSTFSAVDEARDEGTVESHPTSGQSVFSVEQAAGVAQSLFPDGRITYIGIPHEPLDVYHMTMHRPGDVRASTGNSEVWLDQYSGAVLKVRDWRTFTAGDTFVAWLFPLHNGEAFGLIGRWIVFVCGFVPLILYVTALRVWWLKRQAHWRQKRRSKA